MQPSIGIVGLPNVGKSTLFNALTKQSVPAANYPFCTIDPSVGIVPVPDTRLDQLSRLSKSEKTIPAVVEFVDIAGLVAGAHKGEGLGNKFLSHIREVGVIAHVVRVFKDPNIVHVGGEPNPLHDIGVIETELVLADLESVTKRLQRLEPDTRGGNKEAIAEYDALKKILPALEAGNTACSVSLTEKDEELVRPLNLLTQKPILYVLNAKANTIIPDDLRAHIEKVGAAYVVVDAKTEEDVKDLASEEKREFRAESHSGIDSLITKGYELLDLITFLTTGEKESRAWTIKRNSTAPEAGMAIHTDFRDKFIRADVIEWQKLLDAGSYTKAREKGLVRTEGKEYIVKDGDVIIFKI